MNKKTVKQLRKALDAVSSLANTSPGYLYYHVEVLLDVAEDTLDKSLPIPPLLKNAINVDLGMLLGVCYEHTSEQEHRVRDLKIEREAIDRKIEEIESSIGGHAKAFAIYNKLSRSLEE